MTSEVLQKITENSEHNIGAEIDDVVRVGRVDRRGGKIYRLKQFGERPECEVSESGQNSVT